MRYLRFQPSAPRDRRGVVLVCVLACMLIAVTLAASTMHAALRSARASKLSLRSRQTQWLLQAGVERARQGLQRPDYSGEVWMVPASQLAGLEGRVTIAVTPLESTAQTTERQVIITAEYGSNSTELTRRHHELKLNSASWKSPQCDEAKYGVACVSLGLRDWPARGFGKLATHPGNRLPVSERNDSNSGLFQSCWQGT